MAVVLMPLPDRDFDVTEVSVPWRLLDDPAFVAPVHWSEIDPSTGRSVLAGSRTTCLPKYMERTAFFATAWRRGRYYRTYPADVEDEVRAALDDPSGQFERGPIGFSRGTATDDRPAFVVEDGRYVSARWPGDAYVFARRFEERLAG